MIFAAWFQQMFAPEWTQMALIFVGCILFTLTLLFYVFMPAPLELDGSQQKTRLAYLYERKDVIYDNLRDLNFEYRAGKLSEADYQGLRNTMEEEAASVLAEIDRLEAAALSRPGARA